MKPYLCLGISFKHPGWPVKIRLIYAVPAQATFCECPDLRSPSTKARIRSNRTARRAGGGVR